MDQESEGGEEKTGRDQEVDYGSSTPAESATREMREKLFKFCERCTEFGHDDQDCFFETQHEEKEDREEEADEEEESEEEAKYQYQLIRGAKVRRERKRNGATKRSSSRRMKGSKINISLYVQQKRGGRWGG